MWSPNPSDHPAYDRRLLLSGPKRNAVLELWEVHRYGTESYGDANYVSIYGMRPSDWYVSGVWLLGRTAVECTRDALGAAIGSDIAAIAGAAPAMTGAPVIDLFAGSANTLYWMLRCLPEARGLGFELDEAVYRLTRRNLGTLGLSIDIVNADYLSGLSGASVPVDRPLITFIAPPWGDALGPASGLDLRRTTPPVTRIVDDLVRAFPGRRLLCAIQVYEKLEPSSLAELAHRFDWSALRLYTLDVPGENHGILLGTRGWAP
ncbi:MAG: hypothetical protein ACREOQ_11945 [Gemmatimonadales bacterium]